MFTYIVLAVFALLLLKLLNKETPPAIFGIYQSPGKWYHLKFCFIYAILLFRKFKSYFCHEEKSKASSEAGYGIKSRATIEQMDCLQTLGTHPKAIDAVYFNLANREGWHLVAGTARRPHNIINGFLYINVPGIGLLLSPKLPDTLLFSDESSKPGSYGAEGLYITPFQPMRIWRLQYCGKMKLYSDSTKTFDVQMNAVWSSGFPYFDFDTDMAPATPSRAMALEPWSREYFDNVKSFHQTHYEQHGDLHGQLLIDGEALSLNLNGVRDHSYGEKREWKNFYRYILHFITLEDGTRISAGIVCAPLAFTRVEIGYVYLPTGEVMPLQTCNLQLYQHGEMGKPPKDYAFSLKAGGLWYHVQVQIKEMPEFYVGWEWEARVVECLANFNVNGVNGWGAAEWEFRHMGGRPSDVAAADPERAAGIPKE